MVLNLRDLRNLALVALLFTAFGSAVMAQGRGGFGGGRGGFGRGGGGITGELRNTATAEELGLTDDQKAKLEEMSNARREARDTNPKINELRAKMEGASDEERELLNAEMQIESNRMQTEAEEQVKQVIGDEKFTRLRQISLHRSTQFGMAGALTQDSVAKDIGLSQDQKDQLAKLQEEQMNAFREVGFRGSPEDRQKIMDDYKAKMTAVLTPEQQTKWTGLIGPPPKDSAVAGPGGAVAPGGVAGGPMAPPRRTQIIVEAPPGVTPEVSFGADAKATQKLKFGFRYAPWMDVLKLFAESANLSLDLNAVPPGTFSYYDKKEYTPTESLDILNGYLLPKGFVLVRRDDFLVCISIDEEIAPNLVPVIGADELLARGKNELLTVVFPLEGVDVQLIAKEIEQVKGPQGKVVGMQTTNSLLVTDIGTNLRRIQTLLAGATRGGPNDLVFKPYTMKYLNAADAESVLRGLLGLQVAATNVSAGGGFDYRRPDQRGQPAPPTPNSLRTTGKSNAQLTSDLRTNSLLVTATATDHTLIEQALKTIDVEAEGGSAGGSTKPFLRVYKVTSADPREVTKTLDALMPGVVVNEDSSIRSISILATEKQHAEVDALIRQLDGGGGSEQVAVIALNKMDASLAVTTLQSMFLRDGNAAPTIQADMIGRQVMVRGTADQLLQVKTLLTQLGEDGTGRPKGSDAGLFRRYPISGRDPEELLPLIERMWGTASPNPIRIVTPGQRGQSGGSSGPVKGIIRPNQGGSETLKTKESAQPSASRNRAGSPIAQKPHGLRVRTAVLQGEETPSAEPLTPEPAAEPAPAAAPPAETLDNAAIIDQIRKDNGAGKPAEARTESSAGEAIEAAPAAPPAQPTLGEKPPVVITVMGDELLLTSDDPAALDQLEELLGQTMEILPPRVQWTVFPLQTADATEIATMLGQLLPDSSVTQSSSSSSMLGSMGGGISSFGSSLMGMTGLGNMGAGPQTLQIVPEVRLNALFVAGPISKVREVEEMLKVLDANEWPDTLRSKTSRMVQLEYADAQEVYDVLKEAYKGYLEDGGNNPQANALAMLMGGGRGGNQNQNQKPKAQLTLAVDKRTNQVVVWSDDTIFQEVKSLVESLDTAAKDAKRTVRVMSLQNTNSSVITSALGQLMPKVKVSTSGPRASSSSSSNSSSGSGTSPGTSSSGGGGDNGPSPDQMRDFFRQQQQQQRGGSQPGATPFGQPGGASPFGSGGGNPFGGGGRSGRGGRGQ